MSKSYNNTIKIFAGENQHCKAIAGIVTGSRPVAAPKNPDKCHLFAIISFLLDEWEKALLRKRYTGGGLKYSEVNTELFQWIWEYFPVAHRKRERLLKEPKLVREILRTGRQRRDQWLRLPWNWCASGSVWRISKEWLCLDKSCVRSQHFRYEVIYER